MDDNIGGHVYNQSPPCSSEPAGRETELLDSMADRLGVAMQSFSARLSDTVELVRDFLDEHLRLSRVYQVESCLDRNGF